MENRRNKCLSCSSPKIAKGFPRGRFLRAQALGWNGWKDTSLEVNQSFPKKLSNSKSNMDWFRVDGLSLASFSTRKWGVNQSPIHVSISRDESWLLNESGSITTHPSNSAFESSVQLASSSKAVFSLSLPSTQILIVNSVACQILGYTADELCSMSLRDLISTSSFLGDLSDPQNILFTNGNVEEFRSKDGLKLPIFLFLKKVDTPQRCVAVAELVDRRLAVFSVDNNGKLENWDDEIPLLFQYDPSELLGLDVTCLTPALLLSEKAQDKNQRVTGQTKSGARFPLSAVVERMGINGYQVVLWVYSNLSGMIVLNHDLTIANCNHQLTCLLFGYSKESLISKSIFRLIPSFCENSEDGRERTFTGEGSDGSKSDPTSETRLGIAGPVKILEGSLNGFTDISNTGENCVSRIEDLHINSSDYNNPVSLLGDSDFDLQNKITEKLTSLNGATPEYRIWNTESRLRNSQSDDILSKPQSNDSGCQVIGASSNLDIKGTGLFEFPMNRALNVSNLSDLEGEQRVGAVKEGTYSGLGRHRDGFDLDVVYRVNPVRNGKGWCVSVARDPWELAEGGRSRPLNLTFNSSFNSTSMDGSMTKDSDQSRPNSASMISQSDDVLTSGEYSEYYTNLQQIGKGAFGYVKMAYRNHDGLLVITKFIKKHKIHARSWVVDPVLKMKVPLEVSLLTTLEHPNIVRVVDVFHNDSFFQIIMEKHGAGLDLFEFIDRKPNMDEKLCSYIFRQIVAAVHYLHSLGILHRDIKDENIIINEHFHVKLIDFGSAAFMTPDRLFSTFYGTVEFCSPEVLSGNKYRGPELEVWALGVTLYILVFGENPFYDVEETIKGEFVVPRPLSSSLFALLNGMLEKDVEIRWDMDRIYSDSWVNQPVDPGKYSFQQVVNCYGDEACPVCYLSEYAKEEAIKDDDDEDRTVASSNSFCSLHTIENLDGPDQFSDHCETHFGNQELSQLMLSPKLSSTPRRVATTKSVGPSTKSSDVEGISSSQKRFSLDLNTLKKLCDSTDGDLMIVSKMPQTSASDDELKFYDVQDAKVDDFENYWDAKDEQYYEDSY